MRAIVKLASFALVTSALLAIVALTSAWYVASNRPVIQDFEAATYAEFAQLIPDADLPKSAKDIRWVSAAIGLGGRAHVGRFAAPHVDCNTYARLHSANYSGMKPNSVEFVPIEKVPISKPDLSQAYGIDNLSWFDIEKLQNGYSVVRPQGFGPFIWIDTDRNVLYCWWTD